MRVSRTGSSRLRRVVIASLRPCGDLARTRHPWERLWAVSSISVGGGCYPHPGGDARACTYLCAGDERPVGEPQNRARDHEPLDLARPLVDLGDLRVTVVPLDRELLGVPVAA